MKMPMTDAMIPEITITTISSISEKPGATRPSVEGVALCRQRWSLAHPAF